MITVISATNRAGSKTEVVSKCYDELLKARGVNSQVLSLMDLPRNFAFDELYGHRSREMTLLLEQFIANVDKFLFIIPEYNGSYPGVLKTFIDAIPPRMFKDKKAGIVGVSDGRAGNLRGQEHLTGVLHHLKMHVHYAKPKLSGIDDMVNDLGELSDEHARKTLDQHASFMIDF